MPKVDFWSLACLHSPANWYFSFRHCPHKKDEALAMDIPYVETLPIATPTPAMRTEAEEAVPRLIEITQQNQAATHEVLAWLKAELAIFPPGNTLSDFTSLDTDTFIAAVRKRIPKASGGLGPKQVKALHEVYHDYAQPIQIRDAEAMKLEAHLSDLVHQAYKLTPDEIELMWRTAPPRMPGKKDDRDGQETIT
jgi:hypothetical protein